MQTDKIEDWTRKLTGAQVAPVATAEQYERAIQRAESTYRANKARRWVLQILREYIREETQTPE